MTDQDNLEFVESYFPMCLDAYKQLPYGIQRADVIRYMWLYIRGGMYLDLDYEVLQNFEPLIEEIDAPLLVLHSGNLHWVLTNSLILAKPKQEIFLQMIYSALFTKLPWYYVGKHIRVMFSTGPMMFHDIIINSEMPYAVLPRKLFMPVGTTQKDSGTSFSMDLKTYTKPLPGGTWNSIDSFVFNFILEFRKELACLFGILTLIFARNHLHYAEHTEALLRVINQLKIKLRRVK